MTTTTCNIPLSLHEINAIRFGSFELRSGIISPIYLDLRLLVSYPPLLHNIAQAILENSSPQPYDLVCGVPYTAMPIATALSLTSNTPMIMRRKEKKEYGTKRMLEGVFEKGQRCLVIEDLVTTGGSVLETIDLLEKEGLIVTDVAVVLDREQGAKKRLAEQGYTLHSLCTISTILDTLKAANRITEEQHKTTSQFIQENQL